MFFKDRGSIYKFTSVRTAGLCPGTGSCAALWRYDNVGKCQWENLNCFKRVAVCMYIIV